MPFLGTFYEPVCLKNIWSVCYRLCNTVPAGRQWKERNPTNTARHSPLLTVHKRGLLKTIKMPQLLCPFKLYVAHTWLKDHVFISMLLALSCIPTRCLFCPWGFFWGSHFINEQLYVAVSPCAMWLLLNMHFECFFSVLVCSSGVCCSLFYAPPVSGNILAPLHGFNGHDREYAFKVNTTSVRNWTC